MEPTLSASFAIAGGTVLGTEHRHALRNNQDALAFRETEDALIVVVTDGCSSGHSSEVGARLGAAWLAAAVPELAAAGADLTTGDYAIGHEIRPDELRSAAAWIRETLARRAAATL